MAGLPEVDGVFLVFPSVQGDSWAAGVVHALAERTARICYLSAAGADQVTSAEPDGGILASHALLERLIVASGVRATVLRSSGIASNTLAWAPSVVKDGTVRWPAGDGVRALIHEDDLAAVGVQELTRSTDYSSPTVRAFHLTGPEQMSQRQYVSTIGEVIGRRVSFVELSDAEAMDELFAGLPIGVGRSILDGQAAFVADPEPVTGTVEELLGRPAYTFARWVDDHRAAFVSD